MSTKIEEYMQLADEAAVNATKSFQSWVALLETIGRLYKYPYNEQIMIHAQRPDATACADYDLWNQRNQIAKRVNSTGRIYEEDLREIQDNQLELTATANNIISVLAKFG